MKAYVVFMLCSVYIELYVDGGAEGYYKNYCPSNSSVVIGTLF